MRHLPSAQEDWDRVVVLGRRGGGAGGWGLGWMVRVGGVDVTGQTDVPLYYPASPWITTLCP